MPTKRAEEGVELAEQFCSPYELSQLLDELGLAAPTDPVKARDLVHRAC